MTTICLSFHFSQQNRSIAAKILVLVNVDIWSFLLYLLKIIHIKLPYKWWEFIMFEILRQNPFFKECFIHNLKSQSIFCPAYDVVVDCVWNYFVYFTYELWHAMMHLNLPVRNFNVLKRILNMLKVNIFLILKMHVVIVCSHARVLLDHVLAKLTKFHYSLNLY